MSATEIAPMPASVTTAEQPVHKMLRARRQQNQLTVEQVAERTGYDPLYLLAFERGDAAPKQAVLERIAAAVGTAEAAR